MENAFSKLHLQEKYKATCSTTRKSSFLGFCKIVTRDLRVTDLYNFPSFPVQVQLLQAIDHPCVIRLEDVIETSNGMLYIILELAEARK